MKRSIPFLISLLFAIVAQSQVMYPSSPNFSDDEYRAFDFWIGEWDVDLKIRNEKNEWPVGKQARVQVFPVLRGKATMELWNEKKEGLDAIRGFSLRYFNAASEKWDLILHWPRANWGRTAVFQGEEIHGRFDFGTSYPINDSTTQTVNYRFSDISENSLRWQDFYSRDNGATWTSNWIMEFTRATKYPKALANKQAHTYLDGSRCTADQYSLINDLASVGSFDWKGESYAATAYQILDGCATIIFGATTSYPVKEKLLLVTYNTPGNNYEIIELNSDANPLERYRGSLDKKVLSLMSDDADLTLVVRLAGDLRSFTVR